MCATKMQVGGFIAEMRRLIVGYLSYVFGDVGAFVIDMSRGFW